MMQHLSDRRPTLPGRLLLAACLAVSALAACDHVAEERRAAQSVAQERLDYRPGEAAIYCYRTIALPDCFAEPQSGPPNRLIEGYARRRLAE